MKKKDLLTDAEMQVLEYLWGSDRAMTSNEILAGGDVDGWSAGYLHNVLRSMLKKEVIQVGGIVRNNTQYARLFEPALTRPEYAARVAISIGIDKDSIGQVAVAMAKQTGSDNLIQQLEEIIKELR